MTVARSVSEVRLVSATLISLMVAACGGGGGGGGANNGPPPISIATANLNDGVVGTAYNQEVFATGGAGAKTFTVAGSLPAGLAFDGGTISGTPAGPPGTSDMTVTVTDSGSPAQSDAQDFSIRIANPIAADVGNVPIATIGVAYDHPIAITGGIPPYEILAGLPSGLAIDAVGRITGTPLPDALTATSGMNILDSATPQQLVGVKFSLPVTLEVATSALPDATGGVSYSAQVQAQGGIPNYNWEMTGGNIPVLFHANGIANGTPDASCTSSTSSLDVRVADSDTPAQVATRQGITLTVNPGLLTIPASAALPVGTVGEQYSHGVAVTPGVAPYTFAVTAGALPSQVALNTSTGQLFGTPDTEGTSNFTIRVTDDCGSTASRSFTIIIRGTLQGRNDSIATATPVGNGQIVASISPSGHPNSVFAPDEDYYEVQTQGASTITVDLTGIGGEINTVVEIVNSSGNRLQTCGAPAFTAECMNDDRAPGNLDSFLEARISGPATVYIHIVEWRGDGRPDLRYILLLSGIN